VHVHTQEDIQVDDSIDAEKALLAEISSWRERLQRGQKEVRYAEIVLEGLRTSLLRLQCCLKPIDYEGTLLCARHPGHEGQCCTHLENTERRGNAWRCLDCEDYFVELPNTNPIIYRSISPPRLGNISDESVQDSGKEEEKGSGEETGGEQVHFNMLNTSEEVIRQIEMVLAHEFLLDMFTQADVLGVLHFHGFDANRSTLRTALHVMARIGTRFVVHEPGRGRRATVFRLCSSP